MSMQAVAERIRSGDTQQARSPVYIGGNIVSKDRSVVAWMVNGIIGEINSDILTIKANIQGLKINIWLKKIGVYDTIKAANQFD